MNKNFRILVLSLLAGFAANAKLDAESYQWTGPASGNWNDANNWTPSQVPGTGDTASISGNVAVDIASTVSINGLSVANGSSLTVSTGGVLNILDGAVVFGPLVNAGTVNWLGGEIMIFYSPSNGWSGTINNQASGLFDIQCDQLIRYPGYELGLITNAGTLRKSAATGTTTINIPVNNSGTVEALVGTLQLNGGSNLGGTFRAAAGASIIFGGGSLTVSSVPNFQGPGEVRISTSVMLDSFTGTLDLYWAGVSGTIATGGVINMHGGSVSHGSGLTVSTGGVLNILDGAVVFGPLVNAGTVNWLGGEIMIFYSPSNGWSGTINNQASGLFDIQCDQLIRYPGYELGLITNAGTLRKSAATGSTTINIPVNNSGTVEALVGTINFNSEYSGTLSASLAGTTAGTDYGKIQFSQPPHFSGPFTLTLRNGFLPLTGDTFDIASFPSATGDFSDFVGLDLGNGLHLAPHFEGGGLTLVTTFQPLQTVPTLTISRTVSGVFLRWPGEYTNWALYRSIDLKTWEPATVSGANSTVVPAVLPKEFFRLHELP